MRILKDEDLELAFGGRDNGGDHGGLARSRGGGSSGHHGPMQLAQALPAVKAFLKALDPAGTPAGPNEDQVVEAIKNAYQKGRGAALSTSGRGGHDKDGHDDGSPNGGLGYGGGRGGGAGRSGWGGPR